MRTKRIICTTNMKVFGEAQFIQYPLYVQPKLNGVYCELNTGGILTSRTGKVFPAVQKAFDWPKPFTTLKGELYCHGRSLQEILSGVTPDEPNEMTKSLEFVVFDCELPSPFEHHVVLSWDYVRKLGDSCQQIKHVWTAVCSSHSSLLEQYQLALDRGYEGIVIRDSFGGVWKKKPAQDAEFLCIGVIEGKGKRQGHVGKFCCVTADGKRFNCGGGRVSYSDLASMFTKPPVGKMLTLRYYSTSDDGIPLCAQFISVRDYD